MNTYTAVETDEAPACYRCNCTDDLQPCVHCDDPVCPDCAYSFDDEGACCEPCERRAREDYEARVDMARQDWRA